MENELNINSSDFSSNNPVQTSQLPFKPQTNTNLQIPLLVAVLFSGVIFGFGGYYFGTMSSHPPKNTPQNNTGTPEESVISTLSSPTPTTTQNPESNWNVFHHTKYNYSFNYPSNWQLRAYGGGDVPAEESDSFVIEGPYEDVATLKETPKYAIRVETSTKEFPKEESSEKYVSIKNNDTVFIKFELSSSEIPSQNLDTLVVEQILSTFKFTD